MPKVTMLHATSSRDYGALVEGQVVDVSDEDAERFERLAIARKGQTRDESRNPDVPPRDERGTTPERMPAAPTRPAPAGTKGQLARGSTDGGRT